MTRFVIVAVVVLISLPLGAQPTMQGIVRMNELRIGEPVANVQVSAIGAQAARSATDGSFRLTFPERKAGDPVQLVVRKSGLVVVNDIQLDYTLLRDPNAAPPLTILLSKPADREEMARRFYRLKSTEVIEETYRRRVKELEDKNAATETAILRLQKDRDAALAAAQATADRIARMKPGASSDLHRKAMALFLDGKVDDALALLDQEQIERSIAAAREQRDAAEKEIRAGLELMALRAQLLASRFEFDEARKTYRAAVDAAPDDFDAHLNLARFDIALSHFADAETTLGRALAIAQRTDNTAGVARVRNNLAVVYRYDNRISESRAAFEEALRIYRRLDKQKPDTYQADLAAVLGNLASLHGEARRLDEARKADDEALLIRRKLAENNSAYRPDLAQSLSNIGGVLVEQREFKKALDAFGEALDIYQPLFHSDPMTYGDRIATTLNNMSVATRRMNEFETSEQLIRRALDIRRKLAEKNPNAFLPDVATALHNLGIVLGQMHSNRVETIYEHYDDQAREAFLEALEIRRKLAETLPRTYRPEVAKTLRSIGTLNGDANDPAGAARYFTEALAIFQSLPDDIRDHFRADVAYTHRLIGMTHYDRGEVDQARAAFTEALRLYETLALESSTFQSYVETMKQVLAQVTP